MSTSHQPHQPHDPEPKDPQSSQEVPWQDRPGDSTGTTAERPGPAANASDPSHDAPADGAPAAAGHGAGSSPATGESAHAGAAATSAAGANADGKARGRRRKETGPRTGQQRKVQGARVARGETVLEVKDLSVDFGVDKEWVPAAIGLNYTVAAGEVLAIVGESGSGKSASSMSILGLLPSNSRVKGSASLVGQELIGLSGGALRRVRGEEIAVIFQEPMTALNPVYTVGQQIVETIRLHREISPAEAAEHAKRMLTMVELPDPEKAFRSYPHQLSGGQRQRAMIAQSLSCDPKLLIADEPTTALDVTVQAEILDLIRNLKDKLDSAVILITHDMGVVADLADKIVVMQHGRIVEQGTSAQIFGDPQHEYTRTLLASVPHLGQGGAPGESVDIVAALEGALDEEPGAATSPRGEPRDGRPSAAEVAGLTPHPEDTETGQQRVLERKEYYSTASAHLGEGGAPADTAALRVVEPVLQLKDVAIEYPKQGRNPAFRAVEGVSLTVAARELVGLVGESGSGKTTIGRAAVGLLPVVEGSLVVDGVELKGASRSTIGTLRHDVGMVFQDPSSSLNPRLPIGESIGEPMCLAGEAKGAALQKRIEELLDQVRLPREYRNRYPHELSGGQKQRVGIARALSLKPKLLVADEPTSALDVSVQATVLDLFEDLQEEMGFACLFVTHDLAVIDRLADRIVVMQHGRIVEQGTREAVLRHPEQEYTKRLLAAVPVPDPETQRARREVRSMMEHHVS